MPLTWSRNSPKAPCATLKKIPKLNDASLTEAAVSLTDHPTLRLGPERDGQRRAVNALIEQAFGPGRFAKTAERLREGNKTLAHFSMVASEGDKVLGAVRLWPIRIGETPCLFLGPIAVDQAARSQGLGAELVRASLRAMEADAGLDAKAVLLVGEAGFFEPLGFCRVPPGAALLPGPVDARRIFWRPIRHAPLEGVQGRVGLP